MRKLCCALALLLGFVGSAQCEPAAAEHPRHQPTVVITHPMKEARWEQFSLVLRSLGDVGHTTIQVDGVSFYLPCMCAASIPPKAKADSEGMFHVVDPDAEHYAEHLKTWVTRYAGNPVMVTIGDRVALKDVLVVVELLNHHEFHVRFEETAKPGSVDPRKIHIVVDPSR